MRPIPFVLSSSLLAWTLSCTSTTEDTTRLVDQSSVAPGTKVAQNGKEIELYPGSLKIGDNFIEKGKAVDIKFNNRVTVVNLVPSVDTSVCEEQTHKLGESEILGPGIDRMVISRDLPMAQRRFAAESGLENIRYYSDYKDGAFGKETGLLLKGPELLTRGVLVLDREGIVRYMQFVSHIEQLPDMDKAFAFAKQLAGKGA